MKISMMSTTKIKKTKNNCFYLNKGVLKEGCKRVLKAGSDGFITKYSILVLYSILNVPSH